MRGLGVGYKVPLERLMNESQCACAPAAFIEAEIWGKGTAMMTGSHGVRAQQG